MSLEPDAGLSESTVEKLQKLIRANLDSSVGFRESAEAIEDPRLTKLFRKIGVQRRVMADRLQNMIEFNGRKAEDDGSVAAKTHRVWINIRSEIHRGTPSMLLAEAERGEDHIAEAYQELVGETIGSPLNRLLIEQCAVVEAGHDQVRDLRRSCEKN